jgi:hypothetical protein
MRTTAAGSIEVKASRAPGFSRHIGLRTLPGKSSEAAVVQADRRPRSKEEAERGDPSRQLLRAVPLVA